MAAAPPNKRRPVKNNGGASRRASLMTSQFRPQIRSTKIRHRAAGASSDRLRYMIRCSSACCRGVRDANTKRSQKQGLDLDRGMSAGHARKLRRMQAVDLAKHEMWPGLAEAPLHDGRDVLAVQASAGCSIAAGRGRSLAR